MCDEFSIQIIYQFDHPFYFLLLGEPVDDEVRDEWVNILFYDFLYLLWAKRRKQNTVKACLLCLLLNLLVDVLRISKDKRPFSVVESHKPHTRVKVFELDKLLFLLSLGANNMVFIKLSFLYGIVKQVKVLKPLVVFFFEDLELF